MGRGYRQVESGEGAVAAAAIGKDRTEEQVAENDPKATEEKQKQAEAAAKEAEKSETSAPSGGTATTTTRTPPSSGTGRR